MTHTVLPWSQWGRCQLQALSCCPDFALSVGVAVGAERCVYRQQRRKEAGEVHEEVGQLCTGAFIWFSALPLLSSAGNWTPILSSPLSPAIHFPMAASEPSDSRSKLCALAPVSVLGFL